MSSPTKNFDGFPKNSLKIYDLDRKLNVAESVRGCFYAVQGARTRLETTRELKTLVVSASRFQSRTHALNIIEASPERFGGIYFSVQIMNFK